ncbi:MAG: GIY-YIG nuclease family protein [Promethearchaeota archaeon]
MLTVSLFVKDGIIYFAEAKALNLIKIIYAENIKKKLETLNHKSPTEIILIKAIKGDQSKEREIQEKFRDIRVKGDWFQYNEDLIDFIEKSEGILLNKNTKLSHQQKIILEELAKTRYNSIWVSGLSWKVANRQNKGHNDRIWTSKGALEKEKADINKDIESGKSKEEIKNKMKIFSIMSSFISQIHRKNSLLTRKHSASFSRSLKRLEDRNLIIRQRNCSEKGDRTIRVSLSDKGKRLCIRLGYIENSETKE